MFARTGVAGKLHAGFTTVVLMAVATGAGGFYFLKEYSDDAHFGAAALEMDGMAGQLGTLQNEFTAIGIEHKARGEEIVKEHQAITQEYETDLAAVRATNPDEGYVVALARFGELVDKYEKSCAELAKQHRKIEQAKDDLQAQCSAMNQQVVKVVKEREAEWAQKETSGADSAAIAIEANLVRQLLQCDMLSKEICYVHVQFMLDKQTQRVRAAEEALGRMRAAFATARTLISQARWTSPKRPATWRRWRRRSNRSAVFNRFWRP